MISKKIFIGIAAGICSAIFLGYCIYFDKQRQGDPEFKKKLRERRRAQKITLEECKKFTTPLPDMKNHEEVQSFFLQELQLGEELLAIGDIENGVEHLGNAVAVFGQPNQLLLVLQQAVPPQVFHLLVQRLTFILPRIQNLSPSLQEEDIE